MSRNSEFVEFLVEQLEGFGSIEIKRMFGGYSFNKDRLSFAIIIDDQIYFKVDETNISKYKELGSYPFSYEKQGKEIVISSWVVPADIIENADEFSKWADESYKIALKKKKK